MIREALSLERLCAMEPDEAAALLVARRADGLAPGEEQVESDWLAADEAHRRALAAAERGWDWLAAPADHEVIAAMRAHALACRKRNWLPAMPAAAAAAAVVLVACASLFLFLASGWQTPTGKGGGGDAPVRYASAAETRDIRLPDGSRLTLDVQSEALAKFGGGERIVTLVRGRAYFDVAPREAQPFSVVADDRRVIALGTRFDVRLGPGELTVTLVEGKVSVGPSDGSARPVELSPGEQFVEKDGSAVVRKLIQGRGDATSWARGQLTFDDVTLQEAVAEVNRYSKTKITISSPSVASLRISGEFRAGDAGRFAETVAELHPVRAVRTDDRIELAPGR